MTDGRRPTLTLDTSCISALANPQPTNDSDEVGALNEIVDLARRDRAVIQLTAAYDRDFERWRDDAGKAARLDWISNVPVIRSVGGVFRLDVSVLDGRDVLGDDDDVALDERLRAILAPTKLGVEIPGDDVAPGVAAKAFSDIDHLTAHRRSGADAFVTLDYSTILKRRHLLQREGIVVCLPTEALGHLGLF